MSLAVTAACGSADYRADHPFKAKIQLSRAVDDINNLMHGAQQSRPSGHGQDVIGREAHDFLCELNGRLQFCRNVVQIEGFKPGHCQLLLMLRAKCIAERTDSSLAAGPIPWPTLSARGRRLPLAACAAS